MVVVYISDPENPAKVKMLHPWANLSHTQTTRFGWQKHEPQLETCSNPKLGFNFFKCVSDPSWIINTKTKLSPNMEKENSN